MLADLNYRNLDDEPAFAGDQHLHGVPRQGHRRPARREGARRRAGRGGPRPRRDHAWPCTSRTSPGRATSVTCDDRAHGRAPGARRRARAASTTPPSPSGGNAYDRRVCRGLAGDGWAVHERAVAGGWPRPDAAARAALAAALAAVPDGAVVLVDGLVACGVPDVVVPQARRLALVVLVHLPLGDEVGARRPELAAREREALHAASAVVATSPWAAPAARRAARARPRPGARRGARASTPRRSPPARTARAALLCVGSVTPTKGQDLLVDALAAVADLPWSCDARRPAAPRPGVRRRAPRRDRPARARRAGAADRPAHRRASSPRPTPPPTCWCCPRAPRPTGWSSPRRWPGGSRCSRAPPAACRRRSVTTPDGRVPGIVVPADAPRHSPPRCAGGWRSGAARRAPSRGARAPRHAARVGGDVDDAWPQCWTLPSGTPA